MSMNSFHCLLMKKIWDALTGMKDNSYLKHIAYLCLEANVAKKMIVPHVEK